MWKTEIGWCVYSGKAWCFRKMSIAVMCLAHCGREESRGGRLHEHCAETMKPGSRSCCRDGEQMANLTGEIYSFIQQIVIRYCMHYSNNI